MELPIPIVPIAKALELLKSCNFVTVDFDTYKHIKASIDLLETAIDQLTAKT